MYGYYMPTIALQNLCGVTPSLSYLGAGETVAPKVVDYLGCEELPQNGRNMAFDPYSIGSPGNPAPTHQGFDNMTSMKLRSHIWGIVRFPDPYFFSSSN